MEEVVYIIIVCALVIILGIALIFVKKIEKYKLQEYKNLVLNSEKYFQELELFEGRYLEMVEYHGANIEFSFKNKYSFDYISNLTLKKNYSFIQDKVIYVFNEKLSVKPSIIEYNGKKYFEITDKIKSVNILVSFEKQSHILANYKVIKNGNKYQLTIDEEGVSVNE